MVDRSVIHYVKQELDAGYNKDQIANALRMQGYSDSEISQAFNSARNVNQPRGYSGMPKGVSHINLQRHKKLIIGTVAVLVVIILGVALISNLKSGGSSNISAGGDSGDSGSNSGSDVINGGDSGKIPGDESPGEILFGSYNPNLVFAVTEIQPASYVREFTYDHDERDVFNSGEDVYIYTKLQGVKYESRGNDSYYMNIYQGLKLFKEGNPVYDLDEVIGSRREKIVRGDERNNYFNYRTQLGARFLTPGDYTFTAIFHDVVSGETATETTRFTVQ